MSLSAGQVIDDKYRIVRLLGTGGMGAVYEGENTRIRRRVAIKVLHASFSGNADTVARFEREAQAAARIGSEHICEVLDLGHLPDSSRYMVMEYLDGETLSARIKRFGRLAPDQSIAVMTQVLDALFAAHNAGIIHRDLKPDNIFILPSKAGRTDFIKILDFGVSKFSQIGGEEMNVTRAGAVVGTPYYMSPEQARGMAVVDARSDIYSLGVVLYQATTGQVPFRAETFNELLFKIALELPPPPHQFVPDIDQDFAQIIQRAMSREQINRFQTCAEFKEALLAWQASRQAAGQAMPVMRAPTSPPGRLSAPAGAFIPGTNTPAPGVFPGVNVMTPPPGVIPGVGPVGMPPGAMPMEGAQATANAWGNTSGAGQPAPPKPQKSGAILGAVVALVVAAGLGVAGYFVLAKKEPQAQAGGSIPTAATTTPPPPPTTPSVAPPATAEDPPIAPPPVESAAPVETTATPTPTPSIKGTSTAKALGSAAPKPSATTTKKGGGADFGY